MDCQHRFHWLMAFFAGALSLCVLPLAASDSTRPVPNLMLKTLYWPPYTAETMEGEGLLTREIRTTLEARGFTVSTEFVPWARILSNAEHSFKQMDAFFPAYPSHRYLDFCELSSPIGISPLGIIHHKQRSLEWQQTSDLNHAVLGVVQGYANTEEIDALIQDGALQVEAASSDLQNIIKVATGRIDAAVMDRNVYEWLLKHEPSITGIEKQVVFHPKLLASQSLHLCVLKGPHQKALLEVFR